MSNLPPPPQQHLSNSSPNQQQKNQQHAKPQTQQTQQQQQQQPQPHSQTTQSGSLPTAKIQPVARSVLFPFEETTYGYDTSTSEEDDDDDDEDEDSDENSDDDDDDSADSESTGDNKIEGESGSSKPNLTRQTTPLKQTGSDNATVLQGVGIGSGSSPTKSVSGVGAGGSVTAGGDVNNVGVVGSGGVNSSTNSNVTSSTIPVVQPPSSSSSSSTSQPAALPPPPPITSTTSTTTTQNSNTISTLPFPNTVPHSEQPPKLPIRRLRRGFVPTSSSSSGNSGGSGSGSVVNQGGKDSITSNSNSNTAATATALGLAGLGRSKSAGGGLGAGIGAGTGLVNKVIYKLSHKDSKDSKGSGIIEDRDGKRQDKDRLFDNNRNDRMNGNGNGNGGSGYMRLNSGSTLSNATNNTNSNIGNNSMKFTNAPQSSLQAQAQVPGRYNDVSGRFSPDNTSYSTNSTAFGFGSAEKRRSSAGNVVRRVDSSDNDNSKAFMNENDYNNTDNNFSGGGGGGRRNGNGDNDYDSLLGYDTQLSKGRRNEESSNSTSSFNSNSGARKNERRVYERGTSGSGVSGDRSNVRNASTNASANAKMNGYDKSRIVGISSNTAADANACTNMNMKMNINMNNTNNNNAFNSNQQTNLTQNEYELMSSHYYHILQTLQTVPSEHSGRINLVGMNEFQAMPVGPAVDLYYRTLNHYNSVIGGQQVYSMQHANQNNQSVFTDNQLYQNQNQINALSYAPPGVGMLDEARGIMTNNGSSISGDGGYVGNGEGLVGYGSFQGHGHGHGHGQEQSVLNGDNGYVNGNDNQAVNPMHAIHLQQLQQQQQLQHQQQQQPKHSPILKSPSTHMKNQTHIPKSLSKNIAKVVISGIGVPASTTLSALAALGVPTPALSSVNFRGRVSCYCLFGAYDLDGVQRRMGELTERQEFEDSLSKSQAIKEKAEHAERVANAAAVKAQDAADLASQSVMDEYYSNSYDRGLLGTLKNNFMSNMNNGQSKHRSGRGENNLTSSNPAAILAANAAREKVLKVHKEKPVFDFRGYTHNYNEGMYVHSYAPMNIASVIGKSVKAQVLATKSAQKDVNEQLQNQKNLVGSGHSRIGREKREKKKSSSSSLIKNNKNYNYNRIPDLVYYEEAVYDEVTISLNPTSSDNSNGNGNGNGNNAGADVKKEDTSDLKSAELHEGDGDVEVESKETDSLLTAGRDGGGIGFGENEDMSDNIEIKPLKKQEKEVANASLAASPTNVSFLSEDTALNVSVTSVGSDGSNGTLNPPLSISPAPLDPNNAATTTTSSSTTTTTTASTTIPQIYNDFTAQQEEQRTTIENTGGIMSPPSFPLPSQDPPPFDNPDAFVPTRNIFIFPSGCVVFWNYPKKTELAFLRFIDDMGEERVSSEESDKAFDELTYNYDIPKTVQVPPAANVAANVTANVPGAVGVGVGVGAVSVGDIRQRGMSDMMLDTTTASTTNIMPRNPSDISNATDTPSSSSLLQTVIEGVRLDGQTPSQVNCASNAHHHNGNLNQKGSNIQGRHPHQQGYLNHSLVLPPVSGGPAVKPAAAVPTPVSFKARHDHLTLPSQDVLLKTSLSYALAQSSTLFIFENRISQTIDSTRHIPLTMVETGSLGLSQTDVRRLVGRVYLERFNLNLHSDLLDTPEFFWDNDQYETLYQSFKAYLDVPQRVSALNKRMEILNDMLNMLNTQVDSKHSSVLEWIVIWLIMLEVVVQIGWNVICKDILHLVGSSPGDE